MKNPNQEFAELCNLTDDDKERLTKFIYGDNIIFDCESYGYTGKGDMRRMPTFTTWPDLGVLVEKLVETGKWDEFEEWIGALKWKCEEPIMVYIFSVPSRFCWLCSEFLKGSNNA